MKHKGNRFYTDNNSKNKINVDFEKNRNEDVFDVEMETEVSADEVSVQQENVATMSVREKRKLIKKRKKQTEQTSKKNDEKPLKDKKVSPDKTENNNEEKTSEKSKPKKVIPFNSKISTVKEDDDIKAPKAPKKIGKYKKNIFLAAIIVVVLFVSVFAFANRDRFTFANIKNFVQYGIFNVNSEEHFPIPTNGDVINTGNFTRIASNLVYASDTKFNVLNSFGRSMYSYNQTFSSPVLAKAADSDMTIVYNLGGKEFAINSLDSTIYKGEAKDNIIGADVSKSGVYALVTTKDGYLSKLYVYSKDNKQIYAYSFADFYITCVSIDSKGKTAVLTGVSAHNGSQLSCIYLLDFTKEEPVFFEEISDNILYYVEHTDNTHACIIGDSAAYSLSNRSKSLKTFSYDGKSLTAFDVNTDTDTYTLSLSRSGDGRMCDVYSFSSGGALKGTVTTEHRITSVSTYKNRVAVLDGDTVYLYTKDGTFLSEKVAGLDPHTVVLYSTTDAYILGVSEIRRLDL